MPRRRARSPSPPRKRRRPSPAEADDWYIDEAEAERLMSELLAITAETGAVIVKLFEEVDAGKTIKVDHVQDKRVRRKLRHLCHAARLQREENGTQITFRKPEACRVDLQRVLKPLLLKAVSALHAKLTSEAPAAAKPIIGPHMPDSLASSFLDSGLPGGISAAEMSRHPWMDVPNALASVFGDERRDPVEIARHEKEQEQMRQDWDRLMADRDQEPLLEKSKRDTRLGRPIDMRQSFEIPWGVARHVQEQTSRGDDVDSWRRFDPEKDLAMATSGGVSKEQFSELVSRSRLDSRFESRGLHASFM